MINVSYYKDYRHNYLIMEGKDVMTDPYQRRMITGNRIEGLLFCSERHVNGEVFLYYEITSKQNLCSLYENRRITMKQLRNFFVQLKTVGERISGFLLDESNLILNPEYIYADVETEELSFLYDPFEQEENNMVSFLEFLTEKIDDQDQAAVEIAYKMLELATREQFVLDEVVEWFEDDYEYEQRNDQMTSDFPGEDDSIAVPEPEAEQEKPKTGENAVFGGMAASAILFLLLFYINSAYLLSEKWKICLNAGLLLSGILFLAGSSFLLYRKFFEEKSRKEEDRFEKQYRDTDISEKIQERTQQAYGNTIFIPWVENCENKLYGVGKSNKNHIDLNRLPLTVGKLAGSVDMVIEDQSISRRHARFFREGNRVYMSDLNSTNGSFKNGVRLLPNASEVLEPGDEIRLGKLKFIYR